MKLNIAVLILFFLAQGYAEQFRRINPIPVPGKGRGKKLLRKKCIPVSRKKITKAVEESFSAWNKKRRVNTIREANNKYHISASHYADRI